MKILLWRINRSRKEKSRISTPPPWIILLPLFLKSPWIRLSRPTPLLAGCLYRVIFNKSRYFFVIVKSLMELIRFIYYLIMHNFVLMRAFVEEGQGSTSFWILIFILYILPKIKNKIVYLKNIIVYLCLQSTLNSYKTRIHYIYLDIECIL